MTRCQEKFCYSINFFYPILKRYRSEGFLSIKKTLVTGLLSTRSIACVVAKAMKREGAKLVFTNAGENIRERVERLTPDFDGKIILPCDVSRDEEIENCFKELATHCGGLE